MATETNTAASLDKIAASLELDVSELSSLLSNEFHVINADAVESKRHPYHEEEFILFALERLEGLMGDQQYAQVLKKIVHRDDPRRFYFYASELEAINRILYVIEVNGNYELKLDGLDLHTLPPLLKRTRGLHKLNISNNGLQDISAITGLPDLQILIANANRITNIDFLKNCSRLEVLCLNYNGIKSSYEVLQSLPFLRELELAGNRINDTLVKPILRNPAIQKIFLADNPINAPLDILNDIQKLRAHFNVVAGASGANATNGGEGAAPVDASTYAGYQQGTPDAAENEAAAFAEPNASPDASPTATETKQATEEQFISYAIRDIRLRGNPDKTLLDVEKLSAIFYNLISNSDNNGEHFFGLFGRWGRGKTFFWKYILKNNLDRVKYTPIEFHAWKYQDTPGVWAYLYNTLNETYMGEKPRLFQLRKWATWYWKLIKLNAQRGKLLPLVIFVLSLLAAIAVYIYNDAVKNNEVVKLGLRIGIPVWTAGMLAYITKTFKTDARKIIASLTTNVNFNSQLGFQHEIQQELKHLLKAWIPRNSASADDELPGKEGVGNRRTPAAKKCSPDRIFLFIDDIDRCSEDKIIQIVDYIRVLLHDKEIQDRITVLAAIDERILLHAIQNKYKDFIENKDNDATYKELCREYMDKLFLAGLKLGPLTEQEKRQIVDGFTDMDTSREEIKTPAAATGIDSSKVAAEIEKTQQEEATRITAEVQQMKNAAQTLVRQAMESAPLANDGSPSQETPAIPVTPTPIASTANKQYPYEKWEQEFIKDILARNTESTPRSIRVYSYRYLLGKQLVEKVLTEGRPSWVQWYNTKEAKQCFAIKLLHYGFKSDIEHLMQDYRDFISDYHEHHTVKECVYGYEISLNQELGSIMYQVLTMIIAY